MRNFILFVRRFFNLILFIGLEAVCGILITNTRTVQGNDIINSSNTVVGLLYSKENALVYYFGLRRMNDSLVNENTRLRVQLSGYQSTDTLKDSLVRQPLPHTDSSHIIRFANYIYRTARVINNSVSNANNYITINRGTADGISRNMAVISGNGVVGRVVHVSGHFASILSVLSIRQQVSARLKDGTFGYITWEGEKPEVLIMKDVPQQITVKMGDSIFTTNYSFFPGGVLIGTVFKKEVIKKNNLQLLYLHPVTNFRNLQYVYVVENKMMPERKQLEDSVKSK